MSSIISIHDEENGLLPKRQPLYAVTPQSIDGSYVESMSSYLCNVAEAHGVSPNQFITNVIGDAVSEFYMPRRNAFNVNGFSQQLDGLSSYGRRLLSVMSPMMGCQAPESHLLDVFAPLTSQRGFLRKHLVWSPEFLDLTASAYVPALWRLQHIKVCSKFRQPLHVRCPSCGREVHVLSAKGRIGYCSNDACGADLRKTDNTGAVSTTRGSYKSMDYEVWVSNQTELLMKHLHANPLGDDYLMTDTLNFWFDHFGLNQIRGFGPKYFGVLGNKLGLWTRGECIPKLENLFNFAWVLKLDAVSFVRREVPASHDGKIQKSLACLEVEGSGSPRRPIDKDGVGRLLKHIASEQSFVNKSFSDVARELGRSMGSLRGAFPDEAKEISRRYKEAKAQRARLRRSAEEAEIREACVIVAEAGRVVTQQRVKKLISKPSAVISSHGRRVIKEMRYRQLNLGVDKKVVKCA